MNSNVHNMFFSKEFDIFSESNHEVKGVGYVSNTVPFKCPFFITGVISNTTNVFGSGEAASTCLLV